MVDKDYSPQFTQRGKIGAVKAWTFKSIH